KSGDLLPPDDLYEACRVMAKHVIHKGGLEWDFAKLHTMPIDPRFKKLVESYLASVLASPSRRKGWKLPETTLIFPWIVRMFPDLPLVKMAVKPEVVGRWKSDKGKHDFTFFEEDMREHGYLAEGKAPRKAKRRAKV